MELAPSFPQQVEFDLLAIRLFHFSFDKVGIFRPGEAAALIKAANETDSESLNQSSAARCIQSRKPLEFRRSNTQGGKRSIECSVWNGNGNVCSIYGHPRCNTKSI